MPTARTAKPIAQSTPRLPSPSLNGDILGTGVAATSMVGSRITAAIYGRNGVGKTTFACQGEGPIALISIEPSPTGGARSVATSDNVTVYQVASRPIIGPDGRPEALKGSEKVVALTAALRSRFARGERPFHKVVIDGVSSWSDVILGEVLGLDYEHVPAVLGLGKVTADQYIERGERLIRYLKPILDLPCDVWIVAQERDHNPPKDKTTTRSGKEFTRPSQTPFMREAHPSAQEGSFFSLGVADTPAKWIQDACDFVMQLDEDNEWEERKDPDIEYNGAIVPGQVQLVPTGKRIKRLRCQYHPNYSARFRGDYRTIPQFIIAPTPEERYAAFLDVVAGRRTKWGKYT